MMRLDARRALLRPYHLAWAVVSALWYGYPAKKLTVIGVTGTKGKSTVAEMLHTILQANGSKTALASTIRFAIGSDSRPNLFKMTLPGRGFIQQFLARAVRAGATHAVVEITSEAALQYRHWGLELDALVFTNLQREHIESHGSFEKYFRAKLAIGESLVVSRKRPRTIVASADDERGAAFLALPVERAVPVRLTDAADVVLDDTGASFTYAHQHFALHQPGAFTVMNALLAVRTAESLGIAPSLAARALGGLARVPGRAERIEAGQDFLAIVDYAHTPDSLQALYDAFPNRRKICVLGNTGGGRDTWKRPLMGQIAERSCEVVILTNEDPYDEDPRAILDAMAEGMGRTPDIIMDRRLAIREALSRARAGDVVLVTGKGTDPYIMGARGSREPWSDTRVVREELARLRTTA
ncbi:MAG: UDP-N-acetylmuramoyl-L-alanyl-D-glutamate--2,6-diaminopimelate ligase [bacterium]|nr:UDP-N-acetylmuramoyl-L-alanyl-D-glutamate--2,6-diaminopimelate ligase [bacterium]